MFGSKQLTTVAEETIWEHKLVFAQVSEGVRYVRYHKNREEVRLLIPGKATNYNLTPRIPAPHHLDSATHLMIKLPTPIVVGPWDSVNLTLKIPTDVTVSIGDYEIDNFPLGRIKYALYGPPESGFLCRYVVANDREVEEEFQATFSLNIFNKLAKPVTVSKFVIKPVEWGVYLDEGGLAYNDTVYLTILDERKAEVTTESAMMNVRKRLIPIIPAATGRTVLIMIHGY
jgi:hypothetical protein